MMYDCYVYVCIIKLSPQSQESVYVLSFIARAARLLKSVVLLFLDTKLYTVDPIFDMYVFIHGKPAVIKDILLIKLGL